LRNNAVRFRNKNTGAIIDVSSELKGPWEKLDGGESPAANVSEIIQPAEAVKVEVCAADDIKKKPAKKARK
jgi:hypothetical protein